VAGESLRTGAGGFRFSGGVGVDGPQDGRDEVQDAGIASAVGGAEFAVVGRRFLVRAGDVAAPGCGAAERVRGLQTPDLAAVKGELVARLGVFPAETGARLRIAYLRERGLT
jgi:hypothetical protein